MSKQKSNKLHTNKLGNSSTTKLINKEPVISKKESFKERKPIIPKSLERIFKIENIFVIIGLTFGLLFIHNTPPFQVADEYRHFPRAYQIAENTLANFGLVPRRDSVPASFVAVVDSIRYLPFNPLAKITQEKIKELDAIPLNPQNRAYFKETTNYNFINYIPQIIAISILRISEKSIVTMLIWSRTIALIFYLLATYLAIRLVPLSKYLLFFIALLPMTLFQAGSSSADSMVITLSLLLIAYYLNLAYEKEIVTNKEIAIIILIASALTATKYVYLPLILLHFTIPISKFRSKFNYWLSFLISSVMCLISLYWSLTSTFGETNVANTFQSHSTGPTFYPEINFFLQSPLNYPKAVWTTLNTYYYLYTRSFIGVFGWLDTYLPQKIYTFTYLMFFLTAALANNSLHKVTWKNKIIFILIIVVIWSGLYVALSINTAENPTGSFVINGLQGRYFIPFAFLLYLLLNNKIVLFNNLFIYFKYPLIIYIFYLLFTSYSHIIDRYYP